MMMVAGHSGLRQTTTRQGAADSVYMLRELGTRSGWGTPGQQWYMAEKELGPGVWCCEGELTGRSLRARDSRDRYRTSEQIGPSMCRVGRTRISRD